MIEPEIEDLEAIQVYIAKDSIFYAAKTQETFPEIGQRVPEAEERIDVGN